MFLECHPDVLILKKTKKDGKENHDCTEGAAVDHGLVAVIDETVAYLVLKVKYYIIELGKWLEFPLKTYPVYVLFTTVSFSALHAAVSGD